MIAIKTIMDLRICRSAVIARAFGCGGVLLRTCGKGLASINAGGCVRVEQAEERRRTLTLFDASISRIFAVYLI